MIYILLIVTICLLLLYWTINEKEFFSVTIIYLLMNILLIGVAIVSMPFYGLKDISIQTFLIFTMVFVLFGCGEKIGSYINIGSNEGQNKYSLTNRIINVPLWVLVVVLLFGTATVYFCYQIFISTAHGAGISGDLIAIFPIMRNRMARGLIVVDYSFILTQSTVLVNCIAYVFYYIFENNRIMKKKQFLFLLPIIPALLISLLTTSRVGFIRLFVVFGIISFLLTKYSSGWSRKVNDKVIKRVIIIFLLLVIVFRVAGIFTGKTQDMDIQETLYMYFSNALFCFDTFISSPIQYSKIFGVRTLRSVYTILNKLGFGIPLGSQYVPSINIGSSNFTDNIATGLYSPIVDYTVGGMLLTRLLLGVLYGILIKRIKGKNVGFVAMVFIGFAFYPIMMMAIDDTFVTLIDVSIIYYFVYLSILNKIVIQRKVQNR